MIGGLLGTVVRIVNTPLDALERLAGRERDEDRVISRPLESLAEAMDAVDRNDEEEHHGR